MRERAVRTATTAVFLRMLRLDIADVVHGGGEVLRALENFDVDAQVVARHGGGLEARNTSRTSGLRNIF